jgi:hypothetical protein
MRSLWILALGLALWSLTNADASAEKRVALVIGNGTYAHAPHLPNPRHDADDVAAALKRLDFDTIQGIDLDQAGMQEAAIRFARAARTADVAVFYYSGHAMQYAGVNYLVPTDAQLRDDADLRRMTRVDEILADLQQAKNLRVLVLDSCRDNPLADELKRSLGLTRGASIGRGLAKMESPDGTIISYATQAGRTATDGADRNSPFTSAFLKHIEDKEDIVTVFHRIGSNVYETTKGTQVPELSLSFFGEFYLNGKLQITLTPPAPTELADPCAAAESHWKSAEAVGSIAAFQDHIARFPNCTFSGLARTRIEQLEKSTQQALGPNTASLVIPSRTPGYSDWLPSSDYHKVFTEMVQLRRYPRIIEGQAFNGVLLFRAAFEPYPVGMLGFYSYHGMSSDRFAQENRLRRKEGYRLTYKQSVRLNGAEFIQATWLRP